MAKQNHPKVLNDIRPVALISLVIRCFAQLLKSKVLLKTDLVNYSLCNQTKLFS